MVNSKQKGNRNERAFAGICREHGFDARRSQQYCGQAGDADVVGLPNVHVEVKAVERLNIYNAIDQARRDSKDTMHIVAHKKNRHRWLVTMEVEDFFRLYKESDLVE